MFLVQDNEVGSVSRLVEMETGNEEVEGKTNTFYLTKLNKKSQISTNYNYKCRRHRGGITRSAVMMWEDYCWTQLQTKDQTYKETNYTWTTHTWSDCRWGAGEGGWLNTLRVHEKWHKNHWETIKRNNEVSSDDWGLTDIHVHVYSSVGSLGPGEPWRKPYTFYFQMVSITPSCCRQWGIASHTWGAWLSELFWSKTNDLRRTRF